jgi:hypothetical protein
MANLVKIIIFLIIIVGIGVYFSSQSPEIFQGSPREKNSAPSQTYISPSTNYYSPSFFSSPGISDYSIPAGFTRSQLSSYFGKIRISAQYNSFYTYNPSEFQIYSSLSSAEKVDITGWRISTNNGEITVPQAVNVYEPSGLNIQGEIVLSANSYVHIYIGKSPIGKNFRLNKCTGYLQNDYVFFPQLPQNCPTPSRSDIAYLSGECQSYISSLWGCQIPDKDSESFYASVGGSAKQEVECRAFLDSINQGGCFQKHYLDKDFLSNEWRAWVNKYILDSQHDRVLLFDRQGLLVDEYTY